MIQGVLFDMDGVLFDTESLYSRMDIEVACEMGYKIDFSLTSQMLGANADHCRTVLTDALGQSFDYDAFYKEVHRRAFQEMEKNGLAIKPGAIALLDFLTKNNYKRAVASSSNCSVIQHHLKLTGLADYFEAIIGGDMVTHSKPHPSIFVTAANTVGLAPSQCLAIEDSFNGVRSAAAAGCLTVMVPDMLPPSEEIRELAHVVLPSLEEIPDYISSFPRQ